MSNKNISIAQAAKIMQRSVSEVRRLCANGIIVANKIGRDWIISEADARTYKSNPRGKPSQKK